MDHLLKEQLDEIQSQNDDIIDEIETIKKKLGIIDKDEQTDDDKNLDF